jgi:VanZ family protein
VLAGLLVASLRTAGVAPRLSGWLVIGICLLYGAIDELTQPLVGRFCSFDDWLADASGAIAVVAAAMVIGAMRAARLS